MSYVWQKQLKFSLKSIYDKNKLILKDFYDYIELLESGYSILSARIPNQPTHILLKPCNKIIKDINQLFSDLNFSTNTMQDNLILNTTPRKNTANK